ncbi:TetR/AcrR family transcriptional regulator [Quadrisphaera sp. DSM 44207]|uniref:TetR/AcrR family transcriptional regulator n=1 Tax=Quadrisphaera sp. DSM 44207 TaxID=1881057 RepID=UPI001C409128|nr:TetR family transcriptional regulator [Quadrisphaera sp. DSM 44207]
MSTLQATDRRTTRWEQHRRTRRAELVDAALRAITRHGPSVGMDEIAALAGTSKTVLYRHFADKEELYLAVAARVDRRIVSELRTAITGTTTPREALAAAIATYLRLVEADPHVYRFVVHRPGLDRLPASDPVSGLSAALGDEVARLITTHLRARGARAEATGAWGHGLIGLVRAAADHWSGQVGRLPAAVLAEQLTALAWGGLAAVLPEQGGLGAPGSSGATSGSLSGAPSGVPSGPGTGLSTTPAGTAPVPGLEEEER